MSRDANGTYTRPPGTEALPGALITAEQFNTTVLDLGGEVTASARESELRDFGAQPTAGTSVAYTVTLNTPWPALFDGLIVGFRPHVANTGACTLSPISGGVALAAVPLRAASGQDLSAGDIMQSGFYAATYRSASFSAGVTGTLTNGSVQVTNLSSTASLAVGQAVSAAVAGLPGNTTITAIVGNTLTLSAPFAGTTTANAPLVVSGAEWLLLNGALLATRLRLSQAGGLTFSNQTANYDIQASDRGRLLRCDGTFRVNFPSAVAVGAGFTFKIANVGTGDVTLAGQTLGADLVVNGDFASAAGWTTGSLWSIATGVATGNSTSDRLSRAVVLTSGAVYRARYTATVTTGTIKAALLGGTLVDGTLRSVGGTFDDYLVATTGSNTIALVGSDFLGNVDDVSLYRSEAIDGLGTYVMYPGEIREFYTDGASWFSSVLKGFSRTFTQSDTFVKPPGYPAFNGLLWGGGGGGGRADSGGFAGGAGGGACVPFVVPAGSVLSAQPIVIAAGGVGSTQTGLSGSSGGVSSFAGIIAYGGGGGSSTTSGSGTGGGGGALGGGTSAGSGSDGGGGAPTNGTSDGFGGAGTGQGRPSGYGGASGGQTTTGGNSVYGGAGGGGSSAISAGASIFGGRGGNGGSNSNGLPGAAPAGGGGGSAGGASGGTGGRGELRINGVA